MHPKIFSLDGTSMTFSRNNNGAANANVRHLRGKPRFLNLLQKRVFTVELLCTESLVSSSRS